MAGSQRSAWSRLLAALSLGILVTGCAAAPIFDGQVVHSGPVRFRLRNIPKGYIRLDIEGPLVAFEEASSRSKVHVFARCGRDADDVPLSALTQHLLIGFTEREVKSEKVFPFDGREALRTKAFAKLDGVLLMLDIVVLKKDGCVYDLVFVGNPSVSKETAPGFETMLAGFATETSP